MTLCPMCSHNALQVSLQQRPGEVAVLLWFPQPIVLVGEDQQRIDQRADDPRDHHRPHHRPPQRMSVLQVTPALHRPRSVLPRHGCVVVKPARKQPLTIPPRNHKQRRVARGLTRATLTTRRLVPRTTPPYLLRGICMSYIGPKQGQIEGFGGGL